jgi:hypothetical protein
MDFMENHLIKTTMQADAAYGNGLFKNLLERGTRLKRIIKVDYNESYSTTQKETQEHQENLLM